MLGRLHLSLSPYLSPSLSLSHPLSFRVLFSIFLFHVSFCLFFFQCSLFFSLSIFLSFYLSLTLSLSSLSFLDLSLSFADHRADLLILYAIFLLSRLTGRSSGRCCRPSSGCRPVSVGVTAPTSTAVSGCRPPRESACAIKPRRRRSRITANDVE